MENTNLKKKNQNNKIQIATVSGYSTSENPSVIVDLNHRLPIMRVSVYQWWKNDLPSVKMINSYFVNPADFEKTSVGEIIQKQKELHVKETHGLQTSIRIQMVYMTLDSNKTPLCYKYGIYDTIIHPDETIVKDVVMCGPVAVKPFRLQGGEVFMEFYLALEFNEKKELYFDQQCLAGILEILDYSFYYDFAGELDLKVTSYPNPLLNPHHGLNSIFTKITIRKLESLRTKEQITEAIVDFMRIHNLRKKDVVIDGLPVLTLHGFEYAEETTPSPIRLLVKSKVYKRLFNEAKYDAVSIVLPGWKEDPDDPKKENIMSYGGIDVVMSDVSLKEIRHENAELGLYTRYVPDIALENIIKPEDKIITNFNVNTTKNVINWIYSIFGYQIENDFSESVRDDLNLVVNTYNSASMFMGFSFTIVLPKEKCDFKTIDDLLRSDSVRLVGSPINHHAFKEKFPKTINHVNDEEELENFIDAQLHIAKKNVFITKENFERYKKNHHILSGLYWCDLNNVISSSEENSATENYEIKYLLKPYGDDGEIECLKWGGDLVDRRTMNKEDLEREVLSRSLNYMSSDYFLSESSKNAHRNIHLRMHDLLNNEIVDFYNEQQEEV